MTSVGSIVTPKVSMWRPAEECPNTRPSTFDLRPLTLDGSPNSQDLACFLMFDPSGYSAWKTLESSFGKCTYIKGASVAISLSELNCTIFGYYR